jgi:hypothetical protein
MHREECDLRIVSAWRRSQQEATVFPFNYRGVREAALIVDSVNETEKQLLKLKRLGMTFAVAPSLPRRGIEPRPPATAADVAVIKSFRRYHHGTPKYR